MSSYYLSPSWEWFIHQRHSWTQLVGRVAFASHIGLLNMYFTLLPGFACFVGNFHPCFFHSYQLGLFSFCICLILPHFECHLLYHSNVFEGLHSKHGYVQNTTNALHFDHSLETFKALFPRIVTIIWVSNLAALLLIAVPFFPRTPYLVFWASNGVVHMPQQPLQYSFY